MAELANEVGIAEEVIAADLRYVAERSDELPAETGADLQILLEEDRLYVWTTAEFGRPVRLSRRELAALGIGLRLARLPDTAGGGDARAALLVRLETHLGAAIEGRGTDSPGDMASSIESPDIGPDPAQVRETLAEGIQERRPCVIEFLKEGAAAPERRRVHPYLLVHAEGWWYVLGYCEKGGECRSFRLDRTLDARLDGGSFHDDPTFDPDDFIRDGRVFRGLETVEATVRYASGVARRVAETERGDWEPDGGFLVRRAVADPGWLVRHILAFGGDAEVVAPRELRALVQEVAAALASPTHGAIPEDLAPVQPPQKHLEG